jgi:hypothetical protein
MRVLKGGGLDPVRLGTPLDATVVPDQVPGDGQSRLAG